MRTGAEYRESLSDGRRVWLLGEGLVEDMTTHPATRGLVEEYVAWYDRHDDPAWRDVVLTPPDASGQRAPWGFVLPRSSAVASAPGGTSVRVCAIMSRRRGPRVGRASPEGG